MLFQKTEHALSLYNALNKTAYTDGSKLEFNTLENAIYMGMKNDLSFLVMNQMHLYEQQSTYTPNMPLRNLFYAADLLQAYIKDKPLYSSRLLRLPTPHFVVFYNGTDRAVPEKLELRLSDAYEVQTDHPELELKVQILNINPGMNEELKAKCPVLKEYMIYVERIRDLAKTLPINEAVEKAVEDCIRDNVLKDFLWKQKAEVVKMSIYEYDKEREMKLIREDEREIGREEERKNTEAERKKAEAAVENNIKTVTSLCQEFGSTKEQSIEKVMEKCGLEKRLAEEKVNTYWN